MSIKPATWLLPCSFLIFLLQTSALPLKDHPRMDPLILFPYFLEIVVILSVSSECGSIGINPRDACTRGQNGTIAASSDSLPNDPCYKIFNDSRTSSKIQHFAEYKWGICYFIFDQSNPPGHVPRVADKTFQFSMQRAKSECYAFHNSTLPTIRDEDEAQFLINFAYSCGICSRCFRKFAIGADQMFDAVPLGITLRNNSPTEIEEWHDRALLAYRPQKWDVSPGTTSKPFVYLDLREKEPRWVTHDENQDIQCYTDDPEAPKPAFGCSGAQCGIPKCRMPVICKYNAYEQGHLTVKEAPSTRVNLDDLEKAQTTKKATAGSSIEVGCVVITGVAISAVILCG